MAQASLGVCPPAFSLARICIISPTPLPDTACFQHGLTLQALLSIQPSQDQGLPKTFGPAGFQFLILPLWASSFLLPALALMPMSCLPPAGACSGGCELGTGPTAVVLNLLRSKRRLSKDLLPPWHELWAHPWLCWDGSVRSVLRARRCWAAVTSAVSTAVCRGFVSPYPRLTFDRANRFFFITNGIKSKSKPGKLHGNGCSVLWQEEFAVQWWAYGAYTEVTDKNRAVLTLTTDSEINLGSCMLYSVTLCFCWHQDWLLNLCNISGKLHGCRSLFFPNAQLMLI